MSNTCDKYQPRKCWQTGAVEDAVTCCGNCTKCTIGKYANVPTFAQIIEKYPEYASATGAVRPNTMRGNLKSMRLFFEHCKEIGVNDKIVAMSSDVWENYVIEASTRLSMNSIKSIGECISAIIGKNAQKFYTRTYGWESVDIPRLQTTAVVKPWKSLTKEERSKIRDYQFSLYNLSDPRKYLCVTAAWERGMRKCDALRAHWSDMTMHDGAMWWKYTSVKNGKDSDWPVDPDTFRMMSDARRRLDSLVIRGLAKFPNSYLRVREFTRDQCATSEIWEACNVDLRDVMGWSGPKAMHNLRKDACDTIYQNLGIDAACEFSTDCERTLRKHYVAKKHIPSNIVSIAKM